MLGHPGVPSYPYQPTTGGYCGGCRGPLSVQTLHLAVGLKRKRSGWMDRAGPVPGH